MRRLTIASIALVALLGPVSAARADHVPTTHALPEVVSFTGSSSRTDGPISFAGNLPFPRAVAAPLGETPPFERDGRRYMITSSSVYGLHIVDVTDPLDPSAVSDYSSAFGCPTQEAEYTAARGDEAASFPDGTINFSVDAALGSISGWENDLAATPDGRIAVIGTDAPGRCHDPAGGGIELVDVSDVENPRTLHLVRDVGYAHSVTIDPARPWLAYLSTSDENDFIEIVDFRSCLGGVADIDECRPTVARAVLSPEHMTGIPVPEKGEDFVSDGCHDIRFHGDRAYCAAIGATLILDVSNVLGSDGALTGTHLDCPVVDATRAPGVSVTDCLAWTEAAFAERKAEAVRMRAVAVVRHDATKPPEEDIQIAHQAEAIDDGRIMIITDERGGGLGVGPEIEAGPVHRRNGGCPGGGVWFYDITDEDDPKLMRRPDGSKGVFITQNYVQTYASCTVHYGTELPGERLLAFAWYTGGTHVLRYEADYTASPPRVEFDEIATYIPAGAWTIQAMPFGRNPENADQLIVYTGDAVRGMDVFLVEAPAAKEAKPAGGGGDDRPAEVLGRELARTGVADPGAIGLALVAIAAGIARRMRIRGSWT